MPWIINDPEAEHLAHQLAACTGESLAEAVLQSLRARLQREQSRRQPGGLANVLGRIGKRCATLPVLDSRPVDEILGYDDCGLPHF